MEDTNTLLPMGRVGHMAPIGNKVKEIFLYREGEGILFDRHIANTNIFQKLVNFALLIVASVLLAFNSHYISLFRLKIYGLLGRDHRLGAKTFFAKKGGEDFFCEKGGEDFFAKKGAKTFYCEKGANTFLDNKVANPFFRQKAAKTFSKE